MTPDTAPTSRSADSLSQLTHIIVFLINRQQTVIDSTWSVQCYGCLLDENIFISTFDCLSVDDEVAIPSHNPSHGIQSKRSHFFSFRYLLEY